MELQFQHRSFQRIFRVDFLQDGLVLSPCCPRNSQESSPAPQFESIDSSALSLLYDLLHLYMTAGKTTVTAMVFLAVMYGCESWIIKKAECQRIDAFELWCWKRLLRVPWTARQSNQSNLQEINPEYSLEGLILKLKLQYFGHLM